MPWPPESRVMRYERRIASVDGNRITIDAPTVEAMQQEFGAGYIAKYQFPGRIQKDGTDDLRAESDFASDTDEQHATWMTAWPTCRTPGYATSRLDSFRRAPSWCAAGAST